MAEEYTSITATITDMNAFLSKSIHLVEVLKKLALVQRGLRDAAGENANSWVCLQDRDTDAILLGIELVNSYSSLGYNFSPTADEDFYGFFKIEPDRFYGSLVASIESFRIGGKSYDDLSDTDYHGDSISVSLVSNGDFACAMGRFYVELLEFCGCTACEFDTENDEDTDEWYEE